jgi:hypothetical protein
MLNNIININTGSKYNLSAVSKSVETVSGLQLIIIVSYPHSFAQELRVRMNQIQFLAQFYFPEPKTIIFFLSVTILSLST